MRYKAIFFDRDNTLTFANPEKMSWYRNTVSEWSGKLHEMDYEKMMSLFDMAGYPKEGLKSLDEEKDFWRRYYRELLRNEGVSYDVDKRADLLRNELWCNGDRSLFEEVLEVLEYFKENGYRMGVISDTSPSLQLSMEQLGLGKYFSSYTCSDLAGAMKPDPKIFNQALETLGVRAEESLYVDDYDVEADGARALGFTSFQIDRKGDAKGQWVIRSLKEIVEYVEKKQAKE